MTTPCVLTLEGVDIPVWEAEFAQMQGIAAAIALHVQACFSSERAHHEAIAAASETELYGYDINTGWPSNGV